MVVAVREIEVLSSVTQKLYIHTYNKMISEHYGLYMGLAYPLFLPLHDHVNLAQLSYNHIIKYGLSVGRI